MPPLAAGTGVHRGGDTFRDRQSAFSALVAKSYRLLRTICAPP
jgi:hypothetical protein